jgi:hypothetical protein
MYVCNVYICMYVCMEEIRALQPSRSVALHTHTERNIPQIREDFANIKFLGLTDYKKMYEG